MAAVVSLGVVACKDDDDKQDEATVPAKEVEGAYAGTVYNQDLTIALASVSDTIVNASVEGTVMGFTIPAFKATVKATDVAGTYSLNGVAMIPYEEIPVTGALPVGVAGTVVVSQNKVATLALVVGAGLEEGLIPDLPMTLTFVGTAE
ncbi:MAG: hypothetical protein LBR06_03215 [Bacteroidales bacterium]|nr:hypothetical protein [Bacteroidales bacterium]